jgi:hypothetical protein
MVCTWLTLGLGAWYVWSWSIWASPIHLGTYKASEDTCILTLALPLLWATLEDEVNILPDFLMHMLL